MARALYWEGRYERAHRLFDELRNAEPLLEPWTRFYIAAILYQQGRYRESQSELEQPLSTQSPFGTNEEELRTKLLWQNRPQVGVRDDVFIDSADRVHRARAVRIELPLTILMNLHLETGTVGFSEEGFGKLEGRELTLGSTWPAGGKLSLEVRARYREMSLGRTSGNAWLIGRYRAEAHELRLQASRRDVDTFRAWTAGIRSGDLELQYSGRFGSSFRAQTSLSRSTFTDGNSRLDFRGSVSLRTHRSDRFLIGGDVIFRDTTAPSTLYYTPENLVLGRVNFSYRSELASPWIVEARGGIGGGKDDRGGARWTTNGSLRAQRPFSQFKIQFELGFSRVPSYFSFQTSSFLQFRF